VTLAAVHGRAERDGLRICGEGSARCGEELRIHLEVSEDEAPRGAGSQGNMGPASLKPSPPTADPREMPEIWLVGALVLVLAVGGLAAQLLSWTAVLELGVLAVALGLGLGIPTSLVYHAKLARTLAARGELPSRWWLSPTRLHSRLRGAERRAVLRWFFLGGAGFVLTLAGCAAALLGALLAE
jgi:hypothetical protein